MPALAAVLGLLGLAVGSFINVVIARVPVGASVVAPASRCPSCQHPIRRRHNIPVLSWLALRGRCADCRTPIRARYPLVEIVTAALFVSVTLRIGPSHLAALPAYLYFTAAGVALAVIDLDHHRLPNAIVLPSYVVVFALLGLAALIDRDGPGLVRASVGAAALFAAYYALAFTYPAGMGFGDVKLAGVVGAVLAYLSWGTLLVGTLGAFVLGAVVGGAWVVVHRGNRKSAIAFGPFMIAAALLAVFVGDRIADGYLRFTTG